MFAIKLLSYFPENYKLVLAGPVKKEGTLYYNNLKAHIIKLGLDNRVDLKTGFVNNFEDYLTLSDIFLFPSKAEGLGTPLLEAQACAVPVISNDIKGISDTIIKVGLGGFYLCLDEHKWTMAIKEALKISSATLCKNAEFIKSIASSDLIDKEYFKKINNLLSH
jgi:glycosyltransferase involved in cell wall biosynthesis